MMAAEERDDVQTEMDDAMLEGIGGEGGVVPLLGAVFSYLARKTDLYKRPAGAAGAEKLILHTSRQAREQVAAGAAKQAGRGSAAAAVVRGATDAAAAAAAAAVPDCFSDPPAAAPLPAPAQTAVPKASKKTAAAKQAVAAREEQEAGQRAAAKAEKAKVAKKEKARRSKAKKREQKAEAELLAREDTVYELDDEGNLVLNTADPATQAARAAEEEAAAAAAEAAAAAAVAKAEAAAAAVAAVTDRQVEAEAAQAASGGDAALEDALRTVKQGGPLVKLPALEAAAETAAQRQCCAIFYHYDRDRDGVLCFEELAALQRDTDGSELTAAEFGAICEVVGGGARKAGEGGGGKGGSGGGGEGAAAAARKAGLDAGHLWLTYHGENSHLARDFEALAAKTRGKILSAAFPLPLGYSAEGKAAPLPDDLAASLGAFAAAGLLAPEEGGGAGETAWLVDARKRMSEAGNLFFAARDAKGGVVAMCWIGFDGGVGLLGSVYTDPAHRRAGLGVALLRRAIFHARELGVPVLLLGVSNPAAAAMCYGAGFVGMVGELAMPADGEGAGDGDGDGSSRRSYLGGKEEGSDWIMIRGAGAWATQTRDGGVELEVDSFKDFYFGKGGKGGKGKEGQQQLGGKGGYDVEPLSRAHWAGVVLLLNSFELPKQAPVRSMKAAKAAKAPKQGGPEGYKQYAMGVRDGLTAESDFLAALARVEAGSAKGAVALVKGTRRVHAIAFEAAGEGATSRSVYAAPGREGATAALNDADCWGG
jgi:GNAT superfamily N-acetyltransferase